MFKINPKLKLAKYLKILLVIGCIVLYFYITYFVGTGLSTNTYVYLADYTVSEDGTKIELHTAVSNSIGYLRSMQPIPSGNVQYVDFYNTFGGINSTLGAKDKFVIEIDENCKGIYFAREDGYELVLYFDEETKQWIRPIKETE